MQCYHLKSKFLLYYYPKPNAWNQGCHCVALQGTWNDAWHQLCSGWGCIIIWGSLLHFHYTTTPLLYTPTLSYSPQVIMQENYQSLGSTPCNENYPFHKHLLPPPSPCVIFSLGIGCTHMQLHEEQNQKMPDIQ